MSQPLGLSVGTSVLVALRAGQAPVSCEAMPARPGRPEPAMRALADALDGLAEAVGHGSPVVVAVPASWTPTTIDALRTALAAKPRLTFRGMAPTLVTDVAAATTALGAELPKDGILALCDVAGTAGVTLINAGAGFAPISGTVVHTGAAAGLANTITATLARDRVPAARLTAVVLIGPGAGEPEVAAQLSQRLEVRVITADQPACTAAAGALLMAGGRLPDLTVSTPSVIATPAVSAWDEDDTPAPVPHLPARAPRQPRRAVTAAAAPTPSAWYKRPVVLLVLAAALALAITGGLAYTLSGSSETPGPSTTTVEPTSGR